MPAEVAVHFRAIVSIEYVSKLEFISAAFSQWLDALNKYFDKGSSLGSMRRIHALSIIGDTFITVALAGSLFFSISPSAARSKITLYLLLTVAPFAIIAPVIGPILDRKASSRRSLITVSLLVRMVFMFLMARDIKSLLLFPEAFTVLVASKTYLVAKAALIPDLINESSTKYKPPSKQRFRKKRPQKPMGSPILVTINSSLSLLAAVSGLIAGVIAAAVLKTPHLGSPWVLRFGMVFFAVAITQMRFLLPPIQRSKKHSEKSEESLFSKNDRPDHQYSSQNNEPDDTTSPHKSPQSVLVAAAAMSVLRGSVGFFTFFIAFDLRHAQAPMYYFGLVLVGSAVGSVLATVITPKIRLWMHEEILLISALVFEALLSLIGAAVGGLQIEVLLAATIGFVASSGKLAFDSIVQYNIEPNQQGRAFGKFETRFQLAWVIGGLIPTIVTLPLPAGDLTLAFTALVAATSFSAGRRAIRNLDN